MPLPYHPLIVQRLYNRDEVEEYYLYDPQRRELNGWRRIDGMLDVIEPMGGFPPDWGCVLS
ncbi:MAG: hypothetical protein ACRCT1_17480 [Microcoleaceae cyanobacterium]